MLAREFMTSYGSMPLQPLGFLLCHNFARTIGLYRFESVKSTASERR